MLIVDKPAGLVVHPSAGHAGGTLVNALLGRARDRGEPLGSIAGVGRPGIVHRLDKDTSGLIVVAKTDAAQAALTRQFADRSIDKEYLALVRGTPRRSARADRGPDRPRSRATGSGWPSSPAVGRPSPSTRRSCTGGGYSLLALHPRTGRTHQIRAHLAYLGLPIAGDLRYGGEEGPGGLRRQFLHAARLALSRPSDDAAAVGVERAARRPGRVPVGGRRQPPHRSRARRVGVRGRRVTKRAAAEADDVPEPAPRGRIRAVRRRQEHDRG